MSDAEKLEALIQKAIENRCRYDMLGKLRFDEFGAKNVLGESWSWQELIFDKGFARALFPDILPSKPGELVIDDQGSILNIKDRYKGYLQQAVISDNPIDYMYKAVFGE